MSLHRYQADCSKLSNDARTELIANIENFCFDDVDWNPQSQLTTFSVDAELDLYTLNIPSSCHLTRIL